MTMRLIASSVRWRLICGSICASGSAPSTMPSKPNRYGSVSSSAGSSAASAARTFSRRVGRIVRVRDAEIAAQQFEHRQPRRGLAVRDRVRFEHFAFGRQSRLELVDTAATCRCRPPPPPQRSARARSSPVRARAASAASSRSRPTNLRQPAPRGELEVRRAAARRAPPRKRRSVRSIPLTAVGPSARKLEVALEQSPRLLAHRDRTRRRGGLHPRRQIGHMTDRRVLGMPAGLDRAHHHLAGVHADAGFDAESCPPSRRRSACDATPRCIASAA